MSSIQNNGQPSTDAVPAPPSDLELNSQLLRDIKSAFEQLKTDRLSSSALVSALLALPDRPWPYIQRGRKPMTETGLARRLRSLGICPRNLRLNGTQSKGYDLADFSEAFARLPSGT